jgi:hypothetical protein
MPSFLIKNLRKVVSMPTKNLLFFHEKGSSPIATPIPVPGPNAAENATDWRASIRV